MSYFGRRLKTKQSEVVMAVLSGAIVLTLLFAYQNCADPLNVAREDQASFNTTLPFAFDTVVDHVAYMSCSNVDSGFPSRAYFSFRARATYEGSGIRFRDDFIANTRNFRNDQRARILGNSLQNTGAFLQLSVRGFNSYDSLLVGSSSAREGFDYDTILAPLDSDLLAEQIANLEGENRIRYFGGVGGLSNRRVEGSIRFMESETLAQSVRDNLDGSGNYILTMTYGDAFGSDERLARGPVVGDDSRVYGRGYDLTFSYGHAMARGAAQPPTLTYEIPRKRRVLNGIREINLETARSELSQWECLDEYQFMIIRPQDVSASAAGGLIDCAAVAEDPNSDDPALKAIRSVLPAADFTVDLTKRCVVPRGGVDICYGDDNAIVNYTGDVGPNYTDCGYDDAGNPIMTGGRHVLCPQYISVCVRKAD